MVGKKKESKQPGLFIFTACHLVSSFSVYPSTNFLKQWCPILVSIRITREFVKRADFWAPHQRIQILCRWGEGGGDVILTYLNKHSRWWKWRHSSKHTEISFQEPISKAYFPNYQEERKENTENKYHEAMLKVNISNRNWPLKHAVQDRDRKFPFNFYTFQGKQREFKLSL